MESLLHPTKKQVVTLLRVLYPLWMAVGMFSLLYVTTKLLIPGDAVETWIQLSENKGLFRLGIAAGLVTQLFYIAIVILLYKLFNSVDSQYSKLLLILALIGVPIAMISYGAQLGALLVVEGSSLFESFTIAQQQSLTMLLIELSNYGIVIASIFWGLWLLPIGYLANKSKYFPKFIGYALYIGGIGYLVNSFVNIIAPDAEILLSITDVMTIGEVVFIIWLILAGARLPKEEN